MSTPDAADAVDVDDYLARVGVDPDAVVEPTFDSLALLQTAHVREVPFENLAIVGDPHPEHADGDGFDAEGVALDTARLFEKVVGRERGGYCYELNGLFHALLAALGYDVDRVAARVVGSDGDATPPANHHANVVHLHRPFVVDVGMGTPQMRGPTPLDGTEVTDDVGVTWRVVESDRPRATHRVEYREPSERAFSTRYVLDDAPRELSYFAATNDHLQASPDSPFTHGPTVSVATADGYRTLDADGHTSVRFERDGAAGSDATVEKHTVERAVAPGDWHGIARDVFGLDPA